MSLPKLGAKCWARLADGGYAEAEYIGKRSGKLVVSVGDAEEERELDDSSVL